MKAKENFGHLVLLMFIIVESSPFFFDRYANITARLILFSFLLVFTKKRDLINHKMVYLLIASSTLILLQILVFKSGSVLAAIHKPIWTFYSAYLVYCIIGNRFFKFFSNIIYTIAVYTTIIYLLHTFIPAFNSFLLYLFDVAYPYTWADWPRTILVYSIPRESGYFFMRNSGIFHEPGAYALFLSLGIVTTIVSTQQFLNKRILILYLSLLTTFSTVGYILAFLLALYVLWNTKVNLVFRFIMVIMIIASSIKAYNELDFLSQKVQLHLYTQEQAIEAGQADVRGRFYAAGMALKFFKESPIIGRGILQEARFEHIGETGSFGYGIPGLFAKYGIIFSLFFLFYTYRGYRLTEQQNNLPNSFGVFAFLLINIGLLTQVFFFFLPFSYFFYVGLFNNKK